MNIIRILFLMFLLVNNDFAFAEDTTSTKGETLEIIITQVSDVETDFISTEGTDLDLIMTIDANVENGNTLIVSIKSDDQLSFESKIFIFSEDDWGEVDTYFSEDRKTININLQDTDNDGFIYSKIAFEKIKLSDDPIFENQDGVECFIKSLIR